MSAQDEYKNQLNAQKLQYQHFSQQFITYQQELQSQALAVQAEARWRSMMTPGSIVEYLPKYVGISDVVHRVPALFGTIKSETDLLIEELSKRVENFKLK